MEGEVGKGTPQEFGNITDTKGVSVLHHLSFYLIYEKDLKPSLV